MSQFRYVEESIHAEKRLCIKKALGTLALASLHVVPRPNDKLMVSHDGAVLVVSRRFRTFRNSLSSFLAIASNIVDTVAGDGSFQNDARAF